MRDKEDNLYTGTTKNHKQRLLYHNSNRGANFTKDSKTFSVVFLEEYSNISDARKREIQIKKWSRAKKENLIELYKQKVDTRM